MGKRRLIAETGAGQHGVATATAAALLGLECTVYMGEVDTERQELNVFRMELLGRRGRARSASGSRTLKDAVNEALRDWVATVEDTHYCLGSVMGPHPFPYMVRQLQRVVGDEARQQCRDAARRGDPDVVVACVGGGSNAAGTFAGFVDTDARLVGVEAAGGAAMGTGIPGVLHGMRSRLLQDEDGQILEAHSISAGLDYPGVGPEHAHLAAIGRAEYGTADDDEVLDAFRLLAETEGIIPALESAHAVAWVAREAGRSVPAGFDGARRPSRAAATRTWPRSASSSADGPPACRPPARLGGPLRGARRDARGASCSSPTSWPGWRPDWLEVVQAVVAAGADALEVGIPFSDPMIDGPVIQEASVRGPRRGHHAQGGARRHRRRRRSACPSCAMTYYNIVFRAGHHRMARSLAAAGVAGRHRARPPARGARRLGGRGRRRRGGDGAAGRPVDAAGARPSDLRALPGLRLRGGPHGRRRGSGPSSAPRPPDVVAAIRAATDLPVCVGVGVSTPAQAAEACAAADGVVVARRWSAACSTAADPRPRRAFVAELRRALDEA